MSHHVFLSNDLIIQILSFLNVKSLMRFKSVSKPWNTLISDPTFVKLHFHHSPRNKHLALTFEGRDFTVVTVPLNHLIENPSITIPVNPYNPLEEINDCSGGIIGSCNGLICLRGFSHTVKNTNIWFRIWNPATNTISERLGYRTSSKLTTLRYTFGYDNSTTTYKVVVLSPTKVKLLNLRDNSWRKISRFPPFYYHDTLSSSLMNDGVYFSGTINWFVVYSNSSYGYHLQKNNITVDQFVIISLDLGTETYMQFPPPRDIDELPHAEPTIAVLMDCLCFCHNLKGTHFVIWKMTEFGVEQSWTQYLKISLQNLQVYENEFYYDGRFCQLSPLCLDENGDTLILTSFDAYHAILYSLRENKIRKANDIKIIWYLAKNYFESLASIC